MPRTTADVRTDHAVAYMRRLCRHFSHKIAVSFDDEKGHIEFPFGTCEIQTSPTHMNFVIDVPDAQQLGRAEDVVARHLERMANKDDPVIEWERQVAE